MVASSSPRQPLHLLVIAASEEVAGRLLPVFAGADKASQFHRIDNADGLRNALADQPWDAALYLPGLAALSLQRALRQIEETGVDLPLILVAGPGDELAMQAAMKAGARDVIDADRLERLIPAVEREVGEARHRADHRAALEMLNESQARFDALASNLPGMLFHLRRDAEGQYRFLFVSEGCQKLFGLKQQHLLASAGKLFDTLETDKRKSLESALGESATKGTLLNWEGYTKGRTRQKWVNLRSTPHHFDDGIVEWRGIATNITDSKESEAATTRFAAATG